MSKLMKKIERLWGMPIFFVKNETCEPKSFGSFPETESPFAYSKELVSLLIEKSEDRTQPVIYRDENKLYFCSVKTEDGYYMTGPVCTEDRNPAQIHSYYKQYGITVAEEKHPVVMPLWRMVTSVEVINEILTGNSIEGHELMKANALVEEVNEEDFQKEAVTLELQNKLDDFYHHTYQEERYVMECIRDGDVEATRERMEGNVFDTVGILSPKKINHYRYLAVIVISMATREAIAGGLSPSIAYRMSDVYVNRIDRCDTIEEMLSYMREAAIAFATEVASVKTQKALSNYTEQCRDYIYRNYHNKIYLEDIADSIGVSTGHLSRVFRADMGMSIQDYIQKFRVERAANLLKYSEAGISEISDYVCFHSQSHFGNVFKRYIGMTPGQYREKYKEKEFRSKK